MVTVEDKDEVAAFANFTVGGSVEPVIAVPAKVTNSAAIVVPQIVAAPTLSIPSFGKIGDRVIASPFARKIAREASFNIATLNGKGTGSNGRIVADDVMMAIANKSNVPVAAADVPVVVAAATPAPVAAVNSSVAKITVNTGGVHGVYQDFELSNISQGN